MKEYIRHKIFNVVDVKGLATLEYLNPNGKYRDYVDKHDFWELCFIKKGRAKLKVKKQSIKLQQNEIFLIAPNASHSYALPQDDETEVFVVCFESSSNLLKNMSMIKFELDDNMLGCISKIIYEAENTFKKNDKDLLELLDSPNFGGKQAIILQLEYLFICLTRQLAKEKDLQVVFLNDETFYSDLVELIKIYLRENIGIKISLDDICKKMHYSRSFLCKIFKQMTGETIFSYFNNLKLERAKMLLSETDLTISDISYLLGYDEVKYFDYFFKKHTGVAPTVFRNQKKL